MTAIIPVRDDVPRHFWRQVKQRARQAALGRGLSRQAWELARLLSGGPVRIADHFLLASGRVPAPGELEPVARAMAAGLTV